VPTSRPFRSEWALGSVVALPCPPPRLRITISPEVQWIKGCGELRGQQAATLKSVLSFCLLDRTVVGFRQGLSLNNCRANIAPTIHFLIVSRGYGSCYIEVWDESNFEGQYTKTAGRRFSNSASQ
jgi:hypothetical protein